MQVPDAVAPEIRLFVFTSDSYREERLPSSQRARELIEPILSRAQSEDEEGDPTGKRPIIWVDVDASGHRDTVRELGEIFRLHPLALEDVLNGHQRPKTEHYDNAIFMVLRMLSHREGTIDDEQLSVFIGAHWVVTFQERPGDCLNPVRARIRADKSPLRSKGAGYLAYSLMDCVIDHYFPLLEEFGDRLDSLENMILLKSGRMTVEGIHEVKRQLLHVRRAVWPLRDAISVLQRDEHHLVSDSTRIFIRDCHDHAVRVIDLVENYRELGADLTDMHLTMVSNRMNEVMKVLTIIATLFIPLTFVVGVYGMNFEHFPEIRWRWGYALVWSIMILIAVGMITYFWRKGWIGQGGESAYQRAGDLEQGDD